MAKPYQSIEDLIEGPEENDDQSSQAKFQEKMSEIRLKEIEEATESKAKAIGVGYINLVGFPITPESLGLIEEKEAKKLQTVCFYYDFENIRLASLSADDPKVKAKLRELQEKHHVPHAALYQVSPNSLEYAMKLYRTLPKIKEIKGVEIKESDLKKYKNEINDFQSLNENINDVSITDVITIIIAAALNLDSSDIHVEASEKGIAIRYRVDGVLQTAATVNKERWDRVVSRLKVLSNVKINVDDQPQDGRFTIFMTTQKIDVRVSFLPTAYGESVVMRILESEATGLELEALGMQPQALEILRQEMAKPNGMILTTGPTGSGKTTTLYAVLNRLNRPGTKIITLEDPIEYHLDGINQSQVDAKKGYTFAKAIRSVLRQDPDILMVGEVRDLETAEIATQASLTGHLVLTTLHTNDAAGVIPRLLDLGVKPYLLTPAINAVMAQRLVRKLCPECKAEHKLTEAEAEKVKKILAVISPKAEVNIPKDLPTFYKAGKGCDHCGGIGYKGRVGIFEVFTMTNKIKEATSANEPAFKILEQAIDDGMLTMLQDGLLKAMEGTTGLEEVYKVVGKTEYIDALYDIFASKTIGRGLKISKEQAETANTIAQNLTKSQDTIADYPSSELLELLIGAAIKADASDLHIDPIDKGVRIRLRIDGILHDIATLQKDHYVPLIGSIKEVSGFDFSTQQATFDGRFAIYLPDARMDCRVSIIRGGYGEAAVLRILAERPQALELESLGLKYNTLDTVKESFTKTRGLIINTGPTGSGKTTTLYAILNKLNQSDVKIITIEDPIEYNLEGVMQTQIDTKVGYTFANALRSLMRQNPNILMIGEIRDAETAKVAIEASLTGHLVLSTVHANSASGAIARLYELGVERTLLSSSIECSIGQRLVRRVCQSCKQEYSPTEEEMQQVNKYLGDLRERTNIDLPAEPTFYKGAGCGECGGIGYKGRIGLFEAISATPEVKMVINQPEGLDAQIEAAAKEQGFINLIQDGLLKAMEGKTTIDEVFRVAK